MKISKQMVDYYIEYVTSDFILDQDAPSVDVEDYYNYVLRIKTEATKSNDLEPLLLGINYLLCHPEINLENHGGISTWDDEDVREILYYIRSIVYSDNSKVNCEEVKDVELIDMDRHDWWKSRGVKP